MGLKLETSITCDKCGKEVKASAVHVGSRRSRRRALFFPTLLVVDIEEYDDPQEERDYPDSIRVNIGATESDIEDREDVKIACSVECASALAHSALVRVRNRVMRHEKKRPKQEAET